MWHVTLCTRYQARKNEIDDDLLACDLCGFDQLCHLHLDDGTAYEFQCHPASQCTCNGCGGCTLSNINNGFANCE